MSGSNCCFLTYIQVFQEAGKVVWYSHLSQNFPQFIVIHTAKDLSVVNEAEVDVFLDGSCFFCDPVDVGNLISGSPAFSKSSLYIWKYLVHVLLNPNLKFYNDKFQLQILIHIQEVCVFLLLFFSLFLSYLSTEKDYKWYVHLVAVNTLSIHILASKCNFLT